MKENDKENNATPTHVDSNDPCYDCPYAEWYELYGEMVYGCDMSICYKALEEESLW